MNVTFIHEWHFVFLFQTKFGVVVEKMRAYGV